MGGRSKWAIQSFFICFILNGALVAFFIFSDRIIGPTSSFIPFAVVGGILTLILWLLVLSVGRAGTPEAPRETAVASPLVKTSPEPAIQMLSALQREGRLIDFLQEDITAYDDAQIGAAVRNIHAGCRTALLDQMEIHPVFRESEGASVTVPPGFDAQAIRLTGNVSGNPPFKGVLRHRGWQVEHVRLAASADEKRKWILAPAEVEIG